ncbi:VirB3 family type IV secretion system protein [Pseudomonas eucalypticola]|uniref:VirB3 family type IV secretion system protein n=1 Tax=Pseudomonas eucalypticola TaxID=2599595 RepID=UPI001FD73CF2|nr:VirB3 family type IV secretion system protein [Pseudomonas eucalypticola]
MDKNDGILVDTLFVGPTRPTMRWGVTWQAFIINMMFTIECFVFTKNLLWLLMFFPYTWCYTPFVCMTLGHLKSFTFGVVPRRLRSWAIFITGERRPTAP